MRCKAAWWYSAALAAAGSLHLILYVRYVHTRIVRGVRRKLFVMFSLAYSLPTVKQLCEVLSVDFDGEISSEYVESFDVFGNTLRGVVVDGVMIGGIAIDLLALPWGDAEQAQKIMKDAPVLHNFSDGHPLVVASGLSDEDPEECTFGFSSRELLEFPAMLVYYTASEDEASKALDGLVLYQEDKARFRNSKEFQERAEICYYIQRGNKYQKEVQKEVQRAELDAAIAASKQHQAAREAAEEERIAQTILNFREEIEQMEATRLQWSLDAPSEMEAAAAEAEAELDEQFARRLDFVSEANNLAEVLADSSEPAPVQEILGKLGFYWGYIALVLCAFLGVIAYVVM